MCVADRVQRSAELYADSLALHLGVLRNELKRLYFKPFENKAMGKKAMEPHADGEPGSTVAFFGLIRSGDALIAAGTDGLYKLRGKGAVETTPLPAFKQIGGVAVSFERPDVILVLTTINQRASVSGRVPMLIRLGRG